MRALVADDRGNVGAVIGSFLQRAGHHIVGLDAGSYDGCNSELAARVATDAGGLLLRPCDAGSMADANGLRDGDRLEYNRPDPYLPDLLVWRQELAAGLLAACRPATRSMT